MSAFVALSALVLCFGGATLVMIFLVMRAPVIEDFDEVSHASRRRIAPAEGRRGREAQPVASQSRPIFAPHTRQGLHSSTPVNLPR